MDSSTEDLLLAQARAYLMLSRALKSDAYLARAKTTLELYYKVAQDQTAIIKMDEVLKSPLCRAMKEVA